MWLHEIDQASSEERDALARRILRTLCEIAAREKGYEIESIEIRKKDETENA